MELNFPQIFSELPYFPNREKYNKLCSIWPVIRLYLAIWRGGEALPASGISLLYLKLQLMCPRLQQHGTLCSSTVTLTYTSAFNLVLRNPAQTHVLEFNCLLLLHFHWQFPFLCIIPSSALGHTVTPRTSTQGYSAFHNLFQGFRLSWCPWHMNMSMTVSSNTVNQNGNNQLNAESHGLIPCKLHQF